MLCGSVELEEHGEVLAIGDRVERLAVRFEPDGELDGELDGVERRDRYAGLTHREQALISGRVERIAAVFTRLILRPGSGWWSDSRVHQESSVG